MPASTPSITSASTGQVWIPPCPQGHSCSLITPRSLKLPCPLFPAGSLQPDHFLRRTGTAVLQRRKREEYGWEYNPQKAIDIRRMNAKGLTALRPARRHQAWSLEGRCPYGWTDWMTSLEVVAACAREVGIDIRTEYPMHRSGPNIAERRL